jgi:LysM repeat protein
MIARVVVPVVFLVAVIALLSIVSKSGVFGGTSQPVVTPTPAATKTKSGGGTSSTYKVYVVKSGDTLSGIAVKFGTTTADIEVLNPKISGSTLVVGAKIKVPKPTP